jgi:hypothetical protein
LARKRHLEQGAQPRNLRAGRLATLLFTIVLAARALPHAPVNADELDRDPLQQIDAYPIPATVVGVIRGGQLVDGRSGGRLGQH